MQSFMFGRLSHQFDQWEEVRSPIFQKKFFDQQVKLIGIIEIELDAAQKNRGNEANILDVPDLSQCF